MISQEEARALDINANYYGVSSEQMMERAGKAVAQEAERRFGARGKRVAVVCGAGNNGGDGFVAARYLSVDAHVAVYLPKRPKPEGLAAKNLGLLGANVKLVEGSCPSLRGAGLVIDALLGIGAHGAIQEPYKSAIDSINGSGAPVLSVDVPSGLGSDKCVKPSATVTFHDAKDGMNRSNSGDIIVADIGIPRDACEQTGPGDFIFYPLPKQDSHKGMNGRVLVIGGGPYAGAPALSGLAALRVGADLAVIAAPKSAAGTIASFSMDLIVRSLPCDVLDGKGVQECLKLAKDANAMIIGPGLGRASDTIDTVREIVRRVSLPLVIDADAIHALSGNLGIFRGKTGIITPHRGEFEDISGKAPGATVEEKKKGAAALAKATGMTILLKGREDIIADGAQTRVNLTGNPAMTVGGTGDVLTGLCAGMLSKGVKPFHAARIAAFTNGAAGDIAFGRLSYGLLATDVLNAVPEVLVKYLPR
ncbi:MAG: NAD(P)H-hydrate dehydratase [Euryarchaeota archaeon]|nr:NAD(P)H-hydrate dehydratase [Euryarchaeota archaeon]